MLFQFGYSGRKYTKFPLVQNYLKTHIESDERVINETRMKKELKNMTPV